MFVLHTLCHCVYLDVSRSWFQVYLQLVFAFLNSQVMGIPPAEEREASIKAIGVDDICGCGIRPQQMLHLAEMEAAQDDKILVILSDVQLDKPLVSY